MVWPPRGLRREIPTMPPIWPAWPLEVDQDQADDACHDRSVHEVLADDGRGGPQKSTETMLMIIDVATVA